MIVRARYDDDDDHAGGQQCDGGGGAHAVLNFMGSAATCLAAQKG